LPLFFNYLLKECQFSVVSVRTMFIMCGVNNMPPSFVVVKTLIVLHVRQLTYFIVIIQIFKIEWHGAVNPTCSQRVISR
jgi:hypothetical protein